MPIDHALRTRHFLIRHSEVAAISAALRGFGTGPLVDDAIDALYLALREAQQGSPAFRFRPPSGAEHLMTLATVRARADAEQQLRVDQG